MQRERDAVVRAAISRERVAMSRELRDETDGARNGTEAPTSFSV